MYNFKKCKNCKYYLEHYVKEKTCYFPIGGHCINDALNAHKRKNKYELVENCGFWESDESVKQERKESIIRAIKDMKRHLSDIALILKDDE